VLAHSGQQQNFYLMPELAACGLDGLEYQHHANSEEDKILIKEYARQYGLFLTGGSDFHGKYEDTNVGIGDFIAEESGVAAIC
jgi:phosphoribosyl 1,2-cyclic phosphate 1,2-diphosphodiesterase